jgi:hypothetical protein
MLRTSPPIELNNYLTFGPDSESHAISAHLAMPISSVLQEYWIDPNPNDETYQIISNVSRASVVEFVKTLAGREHSEVNWTNAGDLYCLCDELKVEILRNRVEEFILSGSTADLVSVAASLAERGVSTAFLEPKLRDSVLSLCEEGLSIDESGFDRLPLSVLDRVIDFRLISHRPAFQPLLKFCASIADRDGSEGSILFRTLELSRLTSSEISMVGDPQRLVYSLMADSPMSKFINSLGFKCENVGRWQHEVEAEISELRSALASVQSSLAQMKAEAVNFVKLPAFHQLSDEVEETKRISATKTELTEAESRSLSKTEFSAFDDQITREVQWLKTSSAAKSDVNCLKLAMHSLRARVALKSELKSTRIALSSVKSELNSLQSKAATKSELHSLRSTSSADLQALADVFWSFQYSAASRSEVDSLRLALTPMPWIASTSAPDQWKAWDDLRVSVSRCGLHQWSWVTSRPIIWFLTVRYGGNVHDTGAVKVSASEVIYSQHAKNAADWSTDTRFDSAKERDSWLCYDFKKRTVEVTHYSIRSADCDFPRSWVLEGALDPMGPWRVLDSQRDNCQLNGPHRVATFPIVNETGFRCIRLRQTGVNHANLHYLTIGGLELFGQVFE